MNPLIIVSKQFCLNIIATMSTDPGAIMLIVKTLEAESDRIDRFNVGDLRVYIGDIRPFDLARL